jgi:hypothetical protein
MVVDSGSVVASGMVVDSGIVVASGIVVDSGSVVASGMVVASGIVVYLKKNINQLAISRSSQLEVLEVVKIP